jgi:hypothetical protein
MKTPASANSALAMLFVLALGACNNAEVDPERLYPSSGLTVAEITSENFEAALGAHLAPRLPALLRFVRLEPEVHRVQLVGDDVRRVEFDLTVTATDRFPLDRGVPDPFSDLVVTFVRTERGWDVDDYNYILGAAVGSLWLYDMDAFDPDWANMRHAWTRLQVELQEERGTSRTGRYVRLEGDRIASRLEEAGRGRFQVHPVYDGDGDTLVGMLAEDDDRLWSLPFLPLGTTAAASPSALELIELAGKELYQGPLRYGKRTESNGYPPNVLEQQASLDRAMSEMRRAATRPFGPPPPHLSVEVRGSGAYGVRSN